MLWSRGIALPEFSLARNRAAKFRCRAELHLHILIQDLEVRAGGIVWNCTGKLFWQTALAHTSASAVPYNLNGTLRIVLWVCRVTWRAGAVVCGVWCMVYGV